MISRRTFALALPAMAALHPSCPRAAPGLTDVSASSPSSPGAKVVALSAPPPEVAAELPQARLVGRGALRFFGLLVYDARLWAPPGFDPAAYAGEAFALELQYARKLEGEAIAERSIAEMKRVGSFGTRQQSTWLTLMKLAFPDVAAQDRLTGVHDGAGRVCFFHNGRATAEITDQAYARLFFGIWLAPQTSAPALRAALTGQAPGGS